MNYEEGRHPIVQGFIPRLTERGKIKIGVKGEWRTTKDGKSQYQLPQKLDHFVITKMVRKSVEVGKDQNFVEDTELMKLLPKDSNGKLTSIPIKLLYNDLFLNVQTRLTCYKSRKELLCYGDGIAAFRKTDKESAQGDREKINCPCKYSNPEYQKENKNDPVCKINTRLQCEIEGQKELGGVWVFRSTSYYTAIELPSALQYISLKSGGVLAGLKLNLVLTQRTVEQGNIYIVTVIYPGDEDALMEESCKLIEKRAIFRETIQLQETMARKQLMAKYEIEDTEVEDFVDEFHPEEAIKEADEVVEQSNEPEPKPTFEELTEEYYNNNYQDICLEKPFGGKKFKDLKKKDLEWVIERMKGKPDVEPEVVQPETEIPTIIDEPEVEVEEQTEIEPEIQIDVQPDVQPKEANFIDLPKEKEQEEMKW